MNATTKICYESKLDTVSFAKCISSKLHSFSHKALDGVAKKCIPDLLFSSSVIPFIAPCLTQIYVF